jgi:L-asparaginase
VPELKTLGNIEVLEFMNIDSRNVNLEFFQCLTKTIKHHIVRNDISAIVITHGTDTMEQTAYFLQRAISNKKPIILTGAMRASDELSPGTYINLQ